MVITLVNRGRRALMVGCLRRALMTSYLKDREAHPQEKDDSTYQSEWHMEMKKAVTQIAIGAAKRLA